MEALPNLYSYFHLKTLAHKPHNPSLLPSPKPNPNSSSFLSLRRSSNRRSRDPTIQCSASAAASHGDYEHERAFRPRPEEIPWSKELANSVHLIGIVGAPVQIKHLSSGKVLAWTRLAVKKSATDTSWINLTFWDELALTAFQHVEKGQQVYVTGRLVSDTVEVEGDEEKRQVYYKVVVQLLNFIERSLPAVSLYEQDSSSLTSGSKVGNYAGNSSGSTEELWQAFFANPVDWWDNRRNKRNPKAPDFKHKHTGEALWIEGRFNPTWVKSQLAILDTRLGALQENGTNPAVTFMRTDDLMPF